MAADGLMSSYVGHGTHAARPATPNVVAGVSPVYFETDTLNTFIWTGSAWVQVNGSAAPALAVATKTATYTITSSDDVILADATSAAFTVTLPTAVGWTKRITVKKIDGGANAVTVGTTSAQTIDGSGSRLLQGQTDAVTLISDNANWRVAEVANPTVAQATKTTTYSVTTADAAIGADATSAAFTVTLPTAVGIQGQQFRITKLDSGANAVTVATTSSQTFNKSGPTSKKLALQNDTIAVVSDGANWQVADRALGDVLQLDYVAASDLASGSALTADTYADLGSNQTFTVDDANSLVEIAVRGNARIQESAGGSAAQIVIDSAGTPITKHLAGASVTDYNVLAGANLIAVAGLAAGSHTVKVQVKSENTGTLFCRASTNHFESLAIQVIERKR